MSIIFLIGDVGEFLQLNNDCQQQQPPIRHSMFHPFVAEFPSNLGVQRIGIDSFPLFHSFQDMPLPKVEECIPRPSSISDAYTRLIGDNNKKK